jgi:hypothetical protein
LVIFVAGRGVIHTVVLGKCKEKGIKLKKNHLGRDKITSAWEVFSSHEVGLRESFKGKQHPFPE